jgi:ubiquinone/menaquinone biosynthesis C-methylase UbiE
MSETNGGRNMSRVNDSVDFFDMVGQTEWNRSLQRTLIHWTGVHHKHDVLEAGCGAGRFVMQLAQRAKWVTGLDVASAMVTRAELNAEDNKLDNTTFVVGNVIDLPFPRGKFDIVTCLNLLFMFDDAEPAIRELLRVTKPSGQIIVLNPSVDLNPWSAQAFCEKGSLRDFERESFLSWATAAARYGVRDTREFHSQVEKGGGTVVESQSLLDGLATVCRIAANDSPA